jgi:hypothetical protein
MEIDREDWWIFNYLEKTPSTRMASILQGGF